MAMLGDRIHKKEKSTMENNFGLDSSTDIGLTYKGKKVSLRQQIARQRCWELVSLFSGLLSLSLLIWLLSH
jgi:hypothetical protein